MELSIVIPVYNGAATIGRCLDSIFSQGLEEEQFEVICVDDCSPDNNSVAAIEKYKYNNVHPSNLILLIHKENKKLGGGRNTGIRIARGKWILFIDVDDLFINGSIKKLLDVVNCNVQLDLVMFDYASGNGVNYIKESYYRGLNESLMTGREFLQCQPVSWTAWCYLYNKEHLVNSGVLFVENFLFEDADFTLKYITKSRLVRFVPIKVIHYVIHSAQISKIGNNKEKIGDLLYLEHRIAIAADSERRIDYKTGQAMMNHAIAHRYATLKRYLWRLPYNDIKALLKENNYSIKTGNALVDFTNRNATITAMILSVLAPLLHLAATLKHSSPFLSSK